MFVPIVLYIVWFGVGGLVSFPGSSVSKESACKQETQVQPLGQEDPLEKEMAVHSSILAWRIPWTEKPGGLLSVGWQKLDTTKVTEHANTHAGIVLAAHLKCFWKNHTEFSTSL